MKALHGLAMLVAMAGSASARADDHCVQIFYDRVPDATPDYTFGRTHALFLQNLLGHFPSWQQIIAPIETYQRGQLEQCQVSFYLGTYYANPGLPGAFLDDYVATKRAVVWAGYNIWKLDPADLEATFHVKFRQLAGLSADRDGQDQPGFYRFFEYQGETFEKYGAYDRLEPERFVASYEIALFDYNPAEVSPYVVSWARHSTTNERQPYILRSGDRWYVGDSPFSYINEKDRYLIFADVLFDVLHEQPRRPLGSNLALLRLEDIHPLVPLWQLNAMSSALERQRVPYSIAMIPVFSDPLGVSIVRPEDRFVSITSRPLFVEWAKAAERGGASFIFHGFTHQYGLMKNPFNGLTGDDFEFWNRPLNRPVVEDSVPWTIGRLEDGLALFERCDIRPMAWETPHYQASALDYRVFGQVFTWNVGRVIYQPFVQATGATLARSLRMDVAGPAARTERLTVLAETKAPQPLGIAPQGQFFPYEIYGDVYGQRLIPEDLGNVQAYMTDQVLKTQTVDDLIATMRRNRVLRDTWASLFVHAFLVGETWDEGIGRFAGDTAGVERLVTSAREYGYQFIDLKTWVQTTPEAIRKEPIEIFAPPR